MVRFPAALPGAARSRQTDCDGPVVCIQHGTDGERGRHDALGGVRHDSAHYPVLYLPETAYRERGIRRNQGMTIKEKVRNG